MTISIIGAGKLGGALAIALNKKKFSIENLIARNLETAGKIAKSISPKPKILPSGNLSEIASDVILIATQDSEIEPAAARLAEQLKTKPFVFHTSGSLSSEVLRRLKSIGCSTGSIHPLVSISDAQRGADRFANAYFCVEGDAEAVKTAEAIVGKLGGKSFFVAAEYKTLYHAAAVTACGHLVALVDAAIEMLTKCGLDEKNARTILTPLIKSTVTNLETQTTAEALTGTFARADVETLRRHLEILRANVAPETLEIYLRLGERSLTLAAAQGASRENLEKMRGQILLAKKNLK
jgi:predicted short-subunit dehydrogenase-like oxidoreductase (DUF2520 family)